MVSLFLASLLFFGIHALISGTGMRALVIGKIGQGAYTGLFSITSAGALYWVIQSYGAAPRVELWPDMTGLKLLAVPLMLVAIILAVLAFTTPNPTAMGGGKALSGAQAAKGITKITRHPFLVGVTIWSIAHILANGDLASVILFGGFLALSLVGPRQIDAKRAAQYPEEWPRFLAETSWLPFAAIIQGRAKVTWGEVGLVRIGAGVALFVAFVLIGHEWAFGVPVMPAR